MKVDIWDKKNKSWHTIKGVTYIVQHVSDTTFKLNGIEYNTDTYEINFVHSEV